MISDSLVVYTVLLGQGFELPKAIPSENVDYICFTDQMNLTSDEWNITLVAPANANDLPRSSREQKIRPHLWLSNYSQSLYIDTRVELLGDPWRIWNTLIGGSDQAIFGALKHSFRTTIHAEIEMVRELGLDSDEVLDRTIRYFEENNPSALWLEPIWGGMIARRHHAPRCIEAMEEWHSLVMNYSRRDQLTLAGAIANLLPLDIHLVETDIRISEFHRWPSTVYRPAGYEFDNNQENAEAPDFTR